MCFFLLKHELTYGCVGNNEINFYEMIGMKDFHYRYVDKLVN